MPRLAVVLAALAVALAAPGQAGAQNPRLLAKVGPGFAISLSNPDGSRVTTLPPGTYEIVVDDLSDEHNFHLTGPGVDEATDVDFVGKTTWTVTLVAGTYRFLCDPHPTSMRGQFAVGSTAPPPTAAPKALVASVGPRATIGLRFAAGGVVRRLVAGVVRITVRDRSRAHNFHLVGPGVNRKTGVAFTGTRTWTLRLRRGTYRFLCDPHARAMRGSFSVR